MAYADETACCWIFHEDISYHVFNEFSFLECKRVDVEFVSLATDYGRLVWLLAETVAINNVFILRLVANYFGVDLLLR